MNTKRLVLAGAGMICLSLGLLLFSQLITTDRTEAVVKDDTHCPNCGRMLPNGAGGECPFCKLTKGPLGAKKDAETARGRWTNTDFVVLGCVGFLAAGGAFLLSRSFKFKWIRRTGPTFVTRCPKCKRKVRYFRQQAGRRVLCPACMWELTLPPLAQSKATLSR
jgi:hypothetical protein